MALVDQPDSPLTVEALCEAAHEGDRVALAVTGRVSRRLGEVCALLVELLPSG